VVFSSATFLFFFLPCVLAMYYLAGTRFRNALLLIASLVFYAWGEPVYVLLMLASIAMNWLFGLLIDHAGRLGKGGMEKFLLASGVALNLAVLAYFKYVGFLVASAVGAFSVLRPITAHFQPPELPIGISFFTFHAISYLVDIQRREARVLRNPFNMGLYISFFPQLIAGPIIRYHDIAEQLLHRRNTLERFASGVERFSYGLAKKVLVANPLGAVADWAFALDPSRLHCADAWVGIVCYTLQIYFDFSGYSDMAIGLARMFGFEFLENFNYPYIARSLQEFWRRWHLSLSAWFRDYLYIPLGGNRRGWARTGFNLFAVFILCGLWHGAAWTFAFWGFWHGGFLVLERGHWGKLLACMPGLLRWIYVIAVVMVGWIFFRADSFSHAWHYIASLCGFASAGGGSGLAIAFAARERWTCLIAILLCAPVFAFMARDFDWRGFPIAAPRTALYEFAIRVGAMNPPLLRGARVCAVSALLLLCAGYIAAGTYNPFIYFRF